MHKIILMIFPNIRVISVLCKIQYVHSVWIGNGLHKNVRYTELCVCYFRALARIYHEVFLIYCKAVLPSTASWTHESDYDNKERCPPFYLYWSTMNELSSKKSKVDNPTAKMCMYNGTLYRRTQTAHVPCTLHLKNFLHCGSCLKILFQCNMPFT